MFSISERIELDYPLDTNVLRVSASEWRRRYLRVLRVRDLIKEPLTVSEFLDRPLLERSRWLITAKDVHTGTVRRYYPGTARNINLVGSLQLALYEPDGTMPAKFLTKPFGATYEERMILARLAKSFEPQTPRGLLLRVTSHELKLKRW